MTYKRITREVPQVTRNKISASLTGRKLSDETRKKIADGQRRAWAKIPKQQTTDTLWGKNNNVNNKNDEEKETFN